MKSPHISSLPDRSATTDSTGDLVTICDFMRYAVTRFGESELAFGHGTSSAFDEAAFLILETLKLPIDAIDPWWQAKLTSNERARLLSLIERRCSERVPAPYLVGKAYIQGYPFRVDERVIVPRSFIAEILCKDNGFSQIDDYDAVSSVLDLCTGSGCLAIIAAQIFPNALVDAVDLSGDALEVAKLNVADYGLEDRVTFYQGDLFAPLGGKRYDVILTNPPYVDRAGMEGLPPEFLHEPAMALAAGEDGLDIVRRIMQGAPLHLNDGGGMLCELGRCGPDLEAACPRTPFLWIDTENSSGEVFWLNRGDF